MAAISSFPQPWHALCIARLLMFLFIWHSVNSPSSLMSSNKCSVIGVPFYKTLPFANRDDFASSCPICIPLISLSCLEAMDITSRTTTNSHGEGERPYLILALSGCASSLSQISMLQFCHILPSLYKAMFLLYPIHFEFL